MYFLIHMVPLIFLFELHRLFIFESMFAIIFDFFVHKCPLFNVDGHFKLVIHLQRC